LVLIQIIQFDNSVHIKKPYFLPKKCNKLPTRSKKYKERNFIQFSKKYSKVLEADSRIRSKESDRKNEGQASVVVFANGHRANFAICRASFAKSKERTRAPARFPVLKGPTRRQTVRAKQAGHFPF
jgi:hypothetical protein